MVIYSRSQSYKTGVKLNLRSPAPEPTFLLCFCLMDSGIDCVTDQVSLFKLTTQLPCCLSQVESVQTLEMCALGISFTPSFIHLLVFVSLHQGRRKDRKGYMLPAGGGGYWKCCWMWGD